MQEGQSVVALRVYMWGDGSSEQRAVIDGKKEELWMFTIGECNRVNQENLEQRDTAIEAGGEIREAHCDPPMQGERKERASEVRVLM